MRFLPALGAFVLVAMMANAGRPCDDSHGLVGLQYIPFPAGLPSPGGHTANGLYIDDRAEPCTLGGPFCVPYVTSGDGTWLYLETNSEPGLQRGGCSGLPTTPLTGANDCEFSSCATLDPDELLF
jgi:hypothetical protein